MLRTATFAKAAKKINRHDAKGAKRTC